MKLNNKKALNYWRLLSPLTSQIDINIFACTNVHHIYPGIPPSDRGSQLHLLCTRAETSCTTTLDATPVQTTHSIRCYLVNHSCLKLFFMNALNCQLLQAPAKYSNSFVFSHDGLDPLQHQWLGCLDNSF